MSLIIREATIDDIAMLVETRMEVLKSVFDLPDGYGMSGLAESNRKYYEKAIPEGSHIACFAYRGDEFAGCAGLCLYQQMPSPENPSGRCAYVMNVYTRPAFRRNGIGRCMMAWIIDQARQRGVDRLFLEATPEGRSMYEGLGFEPVTGSMEMRRNQNQNQNQN